MISLRRSVLASSTLVLALTACGPAEEAELEAATDAPAAAAEPTEAPEIAALRQVAERYADVNVALAEGFIPPPDGMCVNAAMEGMDPTFGAMGFHYLRPDLLGITATEPRVSGMGTHSDFAQPAILVYEPQADGSLRLVALENLVWAAGLQAAGMAVPSFMGNEYQHMLDDPATPADEAHGFEEHYELHVWIPRDNPNGMFTPFNPAVTCDHAAHPAD